MKNRYLACFFGLFFLPFSAFSQDAYSYTGNPDDYANNSYESSLLKRPDSLSFDEMVYLFLCPKYGQDEDALAEKQGELNLFWEGLAEKANAPAALLKEINTYELAHFINGGEHLNPFYKHRFKELNFDLPRLIFRTLILEFLQQPYQLAVNTDSLTLKAGENFESLSMGIQLNLNLENAPYLYQIQFPSLIAYRYQNYSEEEILRIFREIKFDYQHSPISINTLIGIQWAKKGLHLISDEFRTPAMLSAEKAYKLYPSKKHQQLLEATLIKTLQFYHQPENMYEVGLILNRLDELNGMDALNQNLKISFSRYVNSEKDYRKMFELFLGQVIQLKAALPTKNLDQTLLYLYFNGARTYAMEYKDYQKAIELGRLGYETMPVDTPSGLAYTEILLEYINSLGSWTEGKSEMDRIFAPYPQFESFQEKKYATILINFYAATEAFDQGKITSGFAFLEEAEAAFRASPELNIEDDLGWPYAKAGKCYVRQTAYGKAWEVVDRGLKLFPESPKLTQFRDLLIGVAPR